MTTTQPSQLSHNAIREYADLVGQHYKVYSPNGKADLERLMDSLDISVEYDDGDQETLNEASEVNEDQKMTIFLPTMTSSLRDRFTIAHEIAHYFLHYVHPRTTGRVKFARGGANRAETQANVFASSLLMPESQFRTAYGDCNGDIAKLASQFGVSKSAASVRCSVLNLAE